MILTTQKAALPIDKTAFFGSIISVVGNTSQKLWSLFVHRKKAPYDL